MIKDIKKTVKFSEKEIADIKKACKKKGVTISHLIRIATNKYLKEVLTNE